MLGQGGPLEGEDCLWPSHRAHHGLWPPGGPLCLRVGRSSSSASLVLDMLLLLGGCDLAGTRWLSEGLAVPLVTGLAGRGVEQWWAAEWDMMVISELQQCPQMSDLLRVSHSLPYEWRPLRPSVRGFTHESGLCLQAGSTASNNVVSGWKESLL